MIDPPSDLSHDSPSDPADDPAGFNEPSSPGSTGASKGGTATERRVEVHFVPSLVDDERLRGGLAVVVDVLRATTTIVHALAAGCRGVFPVADVDDARRLAANYPPKERLLMGERRGLPPPGFDLGNSPGDCTPTVCAGRWAVCTTTNGTSAILHAMHARRVLLGAFVNFSAVCDEVRRSNLPLHIVCAGYDGGVALEDVLFAGAMVDYLADHGRLVLNDGARVAWDAHEQHGQVLLAAFKFSEGGRLLID
ncbi:MAG: 2-phosphosulfolactate phosphatase, partial [Planctomycetia bacterium]